MSQWHGGKGSKQRPTDKKKFDENWDRIFGKNKDVDPLALLDTYIDAYNEERLVSKFDKEKK